MKINNVQLIYPEEFIQEIKQFLPDREDIIELAENNDYSLGIVLNDLYDETIEPEYVIRQLSSGERGIQELKDKAKKLYNVRRLYSQWAYLTDTQLDEWEERNEEKRIL